MTRRRWIADAFDATQASLTGEHASHLSVTLRARVGQQFEIACDGVVRLGVITAVAVDRVTFELGDEIAAHEPHAIHVVAAICKFDRYEWAVEKLTELGATSIIPLIARRTDSHLAQAADKRVERWRRLTAQASEQSRRSAPPVLTLPTRLKALVGAQSPIPADAVKILLDENEKQIALKDLLPEETTAPVALALGPEGGWAEEEIALLHDNGWRSASLGATILRAETAAIAALAVARAQLG